MKWPKFCIFGRSRYIYNIYVCIPSTIPDYIHTPFSFLQGGQSSYQIPTSTRCTHNASTKLVDHAAVTTFKIAKKMVNPLVSCRKNIKNTCPNSTIKYNVTCSSSAPKTCLKGLPCLKRVRAYLVPVLLHSLFQRWAVNQLFSWTHVTPLIGI